MLRIPRALCLICTPFHPLRTPIPHSLHLRQLAILLLVDLVPGQINEVLGPRQSPLQIGVDKRRHPQRNPSCFKIYIVGLCICVVVANRLGRSEEVMLLYNMRVILKAAYLASPFLPYNIIERHAGGRTIPTLHGPPTTHAPLGHHSRQTHLAQRQTQLASARDRHRK